MTPRTRQVNSRSRGPRPPCTGDGATPGSTAAESEPQEGWDYVPMSEWADDLPES